MDLKNIVDNLWCNAIAPSTRQCYETGFKAYVQFLLFTGIVAYVMPNFLPVDEELLLLFVAHCTSRLKVSYSTIKLYLCGIRFRCMEQNIRYPDNSQLNRLKSILNGVKRTQNISSRPRYPVTFEILNRLCVCLRKNYSFQNLLLETMSTVAFFGFLRCGEFTVESIDKFDPNFNLCVSDMNILTDCVHLRLKVSKTDPFRKGATIKIFETGKNICPFSICCKYMKARVKVNSGDSYEQPLFIDTDGLAVTRRKFLSMFKETLQYLGIDSSFYSGHSFRIGAATTAGRVHIEDHLHVACPNEVWHQKQAVLICS